MRIEYKYNNKSTATYLGNETKKKKTQQNELKIKQKTNGIVWVGTGKPVFVCIEAGRIVVERVIFHFLNRLSLIC